MRNLENKYPNNLKDLRLKMKLTQKQVAAYLNLESWNRISRWERGQSCPSLNNLMKLSKLYQISIEEVYQNQCS
jgi:transcriptional regulator with XRE-family HTH domain